jgi:hypothetical protein
VTEQPVNIEEQDLKFAATPMKKKKKIKDIEDK